MSFGYGQTESKGQSTSTPTDVTPGELASLRGPFADTLKQIFANQGRPAYTGDLVAGITPGQTSAISGVTGAANDPTRQALLQKTMAGGFLPGSSGQNPYLDEAIRAAQRPTAEALSNTLSRDLPGRFALGGQTVTRNGQPGGAGGGSSAFDRAAALGTQGAANALGDIATNMSFQGYNEERGRQQGAISLSQNEIQGLTQSLQAESLPQMINDLGVQRGLQEFQDRMKSLLQALSLVSGGTLSQVANTGQSTQQGEGFNASTELRQK